jgi:hypothetical protein
VLAGRSVFVPETWRRAEVEREGRRQIAKIVSIVIIAVAAIAALIYAVIAWSKARSDRRAFRWVTGISLLMLAGSANNWPALAMQINTAEPVTNQLVVVILGALASGLMVALLFGLLAGVGGYYARTQTAARLSGRFPAWMLGAAAALATAGIASALTSIVTPAMPTWPDFKLQSFAWPWAGAPTAASHSFRRHRHAVPAVGRGSRHGRMEPPHTACCGCADAVRRRDGHRLRTGAAQRAAAGVVEGATALLFAWLVLRYDLRTVPACRAGSFSKASGRRPSREPQLRG